MKQIPASLLTLTAGILVTVISFWVGQNHGLMPEQASEQAALVDGLFNVMMMIATALFLVVEGAIVYFLVKYRRRAGDDTDGIPVDGNLPLEAFWTAIPSILVIGLGIYSVQIFQEMGGFDPSSHSMISHSHVSAVVAQAPATEAPMAGDMVPLLPAPDAAKPAFTPKYGFGANPDDPNGQADVVVNVTGMQYAWIFNYPDSGITTGELHVPVNQDVQVNLVAQDVIHSFWVPQFRLKQDALPGQQTGLRFKASKIGTYPIVCAELCGSYHGGMRSQVIVHSPEEYETWLTENQVAQQQTPNAVVAVNPANLTDTEFLTPYAKELDVKADALSHLHTKHTMMPAMVAD